MTWSISHVLFFFNDTATTEIYTLSLHDALPIYFSCQATRLNRSARIGMCRLGKYSASAVLLPSGSAKACRRSEEHTSELQSQSNLVCRLLLEKKKNIKHYSHATLPSDLTTPDRA